MYNITQAMKDQFLQLKQEYRGYIQSPVYTMSDDTTLQNMKIYNDTNGHNPFGNVITSYMEFSVIEKDTIHFLQDVYVFPHLGLQGHAYVPQGKYKVFEYERDSINQTATFKAYDDMVKANAKFTNITYPATVSQLLSAAASQMGLTLITKNLVNTNFSYTPVLTGGETIKKILSHLCEITLSNAYIDRSGNLVVAGFDTNTSFTITEDMFYTIETKPQFTVNAVAITFNPSNEELKKPVSPALGSTFYNLPYSNVPLTQKQALIDAVYAGVNGFNYYPYKLDAIGLMFLDTGDKVAVENQPNLFIMNSVLEFDGSLKATFTSIDLNKDDAVYGNKTLSETLNENTNTLNGNITDVNIKAQSITANSIATGTITADKMVAGTITAQSAILADAVITNAKIADLAVSTAKIQDAAITNGKIANLAVDTAKITDASITTAKIADANITTAKIADANITNAKIANLAVDNAKIANLAVDAAKIANATITAAKITDATITGAKIANATIGTANIIDGNITTAKIDDAAITNAKIGALAVDTANIAAAAITTAKIADANITGAKIALATIEAANIANAAITTALIADANITNAKIADLAVNSAKIADASITNAKIGALAVDAAKIANATITGAKIANATITGANIADATIGTAKIATGAITNALIGTGAIDTAQIADGSITDAKIVGLTANKITAGTIDAANITVSNLNADNITVGTINGQRIADGAITTEKIGVDAVDGTKIADNAISAEHVSANAITADKIVANAITADKIAASSITANKMVANTITAASGVIADAAITTAKIADANITNAKIANLAVDAAKIANATITGAKIALATIEDGNITNATITGAKIANATIATGNIADANITTAKIADGNITNAKIANLAVDAAKIADATITGAKIASATITDANIASATITAASIANATITGAKIASATITDANISSLNADKITAGTLDAARIAANTITADKIVSKSPNLMLAGWDNFDQLFGTAVNTSATGSLSLLSTCEISADTSYVGRYCLKTVNSAANSYKYLGDTNRTTDAVVNERYILSAYVKTTSATNVTVSINLVVRDAANGSLGTYIGTISDLKSSDGWRKISVAATMPANTAKVTGFVRTVTATATTVYWDAVMLEKADSTSESTPSDWRPSGTTIVNGGNITTNSITATQIAAGTITATEMKAGTITAASGIIADAAITNAKIANLAVDAAKIANATITGAKIASATITDANISSLSADKITAGTMSAIRIYGDTLTMGGANNVAGIIAINDGSNTKAVEIDSEGLTVLNTLTGQNIATFGVAGASIPNLTADDINCPTISKTVSFSSTVNIGTGQTYPTITAFMNSLNGARFLVRDLYLNIVGTISDTATISGFHGNANIFITGSSTPKINGRLVFENCSTTIRVGQGGSKINVKSTTNNTSPVRVAGCCSVLLSNLNIDSYYTASLSTLYGIYAQYTSSLVIHTCDFVSNNASGTAIYTALCNTSAYDNRGSVAAGSTYFYNSGGLAHIEGTITNGHTTDTSRYRGFNNVQGTLTKTVSLFSPPAITYTAQTRIFSADNIFTSTSGTSANVDSYYGNTAAQNTYGGSGIKYGWFEFGGAIREWLADAQTPYAYTTMKIRLGRKNSVHGSSSAIAATNYQGFPTMPAVLRGATTAFTTIGGTQADALRNTGAYTFKVGGSSSSANYAIWDICEIEVVANKPV